MAVQLAPVKQGPGAASGVGVGGTGGGNGAGGARGAVQRGGSGKASRSVIKRVFERNTGAICAICNRALPEEPSRQGKVVLKLTIAPPGGVVDCRLASSEPRRSELEAKRLARIRQFDFGANDVDQIIVTSPVDFLPSSMGPPRPLTPTRSPAGRGCQCGEQQNAQSLSRRRAGRSGRAAARRCRRAGPASAGEGRAGCRAPCGVPAFRPTSPRWPQ